MKNRIIFLMGQNSEKSVINVQEFFRFVMKLIG